MLFTLSICFLGKVFQVFEEQKWLFCTFPREQIHAQSQQNGHLKITEHNPNENKAITGGLLSKKYS